MSGWRWMREAFPALSLMGLSVGIHAQIRTSRSNHQFDPSPRQVRERHPRLSAFATRIDLMCNKSLRVKLNNINI